MISNKSTNFFVYFYDNKLKQISQIIFLFIFILLRNESMDD